MVAVKSICLNGGNRTYDETLFALIAKDIEKQGYSICPGALPEELSDSLFIHQQAMTSDKFDTPVLVEVTNTWKMNLLEPMKYAGYRVTQMQGDSG